MRATKAIRRLRIEDIIRVRLDGAAQWDVRQYVAQQEAGGADAWTVPEGGRGLSERQVRAYVEQADRTIESGCRQSRRRLLRNHLARRRYLYARAVASGDYRTALACDQDAAKLQGL